MATCVGCGLAVDSEGKLIADISGTVPLADLGGVDFPCAVAAYGEVVCDDATGLHVRPEHTTAAAFLPLGETVGPSGIHAPGSQEDVANLNPALTLVNPSSCRRMIVDVTMDGRLRFDILRSEFNDDTNAYTVNCQQFISFNGLAYELWRNDTWFKSDSEADCLTVVGHGSSNIVEPPIVPAGGSLTVGYLMRVTTLGNPSGRITLNTPAIRLIGHTI